jgi:hypothetical protein
MLYRAITSSRSSSSSATFGLLDPDARPSSSEAVLAPSFNFRFFLRANLCFSPRLDGGSEDFPAPKALPTDVAEDADGLGMIDRSSEGVNVS